MKGRVLVVMALAVLLVACGQTTSQQVATGIASSPEPRSVQVTTVALTYTPTATPIPQDIDAALKDITALLDSVNKQSGLKGGLQNFFRQAQIVQGGKRLNITVSDDWFSLPTYQKERYLDIMGDAYAVIAAQRGLRPPGRDYPRTYFLDIYGKELGSKSMWGTEVYR